MSDTDRIRDLERRVSELSRNTAGIPVRWASGGGGGGGADGGNRRGARVTTIIPAAADNLFANWGTGGAVKTLDPNSGEEDDVYTSVINPLQIDFGIDYWVEVDVSFDPAHVVNGSCETWTWG